MFVDRLRDMDLHQELGLPIKGEGQPVIRYPGDKGWSGISLAWMSHGYEVALTPLQTLTFYNAIANGGEMVKPRLIKEVREWNKTIYQFDKEVINPSICSEETVAKVQNLLKDVVEKESGTGHRLYSSNFSMAGKTGTAQVIGIKQGATYNEKNVAKRFRDHALFIAYAPANDPQIAVAVIAENGGGGSRTAAPTRPTAA